MAMLTDEMKADIMRRLREGASLLSAARENGITAGAFYNAMSNDEELRDEYTRARENGIDAQAEEMHDLEMRVLSGELDPHAFRAAMDARKWRMAKQMPRKYGERIAVDQRTAVSGSLDMSIVTDPVIQAALDAVLGGAKE